MPYGDVERLGQHVQAHAQKIPLRHEVVQRFVVGEVGQESPETALARESFMHPGDPLIHFTKD